MFRQLQQRSNNPIKVGLVGAGCMGLGIAHQVANTPGMELTWVTDTQIGNAAKAAALADDCLHSDDTLKLISEHSVDVFVESTNSIWSAFLYCQQAIKNKAHVVLMNAEVDLVFGTQLQALAKENNVVVTSDAGDQHGVLATMIDEIKLWGFDIVQAGNIKGFLNRYATAEDLIEEAAKRNLNPIQCCAYTDGTKLNIEMALLANAYGLTPTQIGMTGPQISDVKDAMDSFDLHSIPKNGSIDYLLGAEPGGGVYVIGRSEDNFQQPYLNYYKIGEGPYYLFSRPYHLCHLETTTAIAKAAIQNEAILQPWQGRIADVYAFAKSDIVAETPIPHGIGGDHFYGLVASAEEADTKGWIPIALLDGEMESALTRSNISKDQPLTWDHIHPISDPMIRQFHTIQK